MPIINHPIAGQVPVPDELFVGDDQAEINTRVNNYLADVVAEAVQEQGIELPAGEQKIRFHIQEGAPDLRAFRLVSIRQ